MPNFTIHIDAPAEMVFDELSHVERHPSWANHTAHMTMEQTAGDGPGTASHYVSHGVFLKKPISADGVRQTLHRARALFADLLLDVVSQCAGSPDGAGLEKELIDLQLLDYCKSALNRRKKI